MKPVSEIFDARLQHLAADCEFWANQFAHNGDVYAKDMLDAADARLSEFKALRPSLEQRMTENRAWTAKLHRPSRQ